MSPNSHDLDLSTEVTYLKGVGPKRAEVLSEVGVTTVGDILEYYPRRYLDRRTVTQIANLEHESVATAAGEIVETKMIPGRKKRFQILLDDGTGILSCVWFHKINWIKNNFKIGETLAVHGKIGFFRGPSIIHPE
ncbi:MAG: ATP-dependent DNA helicase RecG, partial [Thermoplasmata archaeon]|nr:ATP-dependent DNA helicase RecG [Thermoplasmata archaeon]